VQVTEVRIKLMEGSEDRLRAFCSITLDHCFVVRDLKVIDGASGPFVAMPSRKLSGHCYRCNYKNHLRAAFCNQCGAKLKVSIPADSPQKLYADVAHPVNSDCREMISSAVLAEFEAELARAAEPGYRSRYDDDFDAIAESHDDVLPSAQTSIRPVTVRESSGASSRIEMRIDTAHGTSRADRPSRSGDTSDPVAQRVDPDQPRVDPTRSLGGTINTPSPHLSFNQPSQATTADRGPSPPSSAERLPGNRAITPRQGDYLASESELRSPPPGDDPPSGFGAGIFE
jgi:stage V sporulation protein G